MPAWGWRLRKHWRHVKQANDELLVSQRMLSQIQQLSGLV